MRFVRSFGLFSSLLITSAAAVIACSADASTADDDSELGTDAGSDVIVLGPSIPGQEDAAATPDAGDDTDAGDEADAGDAGNVPDGGDAGDAGDSGTPPAVDIYDQDTIPKFEFTFDDAAIAVLSDKTEATQKTWVKGTFKFGNTVLADVGFRRKGSSTFRAYPEKMALKVKFNKFVDGQTFLGLKELTLNNGVSDPTFLAERLAYHVFRSTGVVAERANAADVHINGTYWGLYANVETPNKDFLKRVFAKKAKSLYEVNYGSSWTLDEISGFEEDEGDGSFADLKNLFAVVTPARSTSLLDDVKPVLDTTEFLRMAATEGVIGHYDGYAYGIWGSHNYHMAGNTDGVFNLLPWSTDLTFSDRESKDGKAVVNLAVPRNIDNGASLIMRCRQAPTCWATYKTTIGEVLGTYESLKLVDLAKKWHAQIDSRVKLDTKTPVSQGYYADETTKLYAWLAARPAVVRDQIK